MKGWEFTDTNIPLKLVEKPDPVAKPGFVVIDVMAAGLCHSDVAALEDPGWIGIITAHPMYMGHENAGIITEIGEGVEGFKVGIG
jgi:propanol-preferring alcohol dehydrogenase